MSDDLEDWGAPSGLTVGAVAEAEERAYARGFKDGRANALHNAALDARERGDIGKDGGPTTWAWLESRAARAYEEGRCEH